MNQRIQKIDNEIERTKAKIAELQALLPELERKKTEMENNEVLRLLRSANIAPGEVAAFVESIKNNRPDSRTNNLSAAASIHRPAPADAIVTGDTPAARQEVIKNDEE
ncbi:MAG: DUF4315 family protein [Oscillospiraceae bacterium]|nr:DUF4315 family protein [Oscillospiraceae bacterium]